MSIFTTHKRRDFIKLLSGVVAAPFVAMPSRKAFAQAKPPLRFLTIIDTYGIPTTNRENIWISSSAADYPLQSNHLGTILQPLQAYLNNMLVVSNISLDSQIQSRDSRTHHYLTTHTLTGSSALSSSRAVQASFEIQHASLDVHIGQFMHGEYGLPSPRIYDHLFFTDYAERGANTFCHTANGVLKRSIAGAMNARDALFGDAVEDSANIPVTRITNQARLDAIVLLQERVNTLSSSLVNANRDQVLAAYQQSVNDVYRELDLKNENVIAMPDELMNVTNDRSAENIPAMFKNIYHAFAFDFVSSLTYAFGGEKINQLKHGFLYNEAEHNNPDLKALLGKNFHAPSHRTDDVASKTHELVRIYQSQELAVLLDRLSTTLDSDGSTILDNTVVFFTSQMSNNTHRTNDYPLLILAGKNTNLQGGFHYDCSGHTNNDLLTTLAQGMTMPDDHFGGHDRAGNYIAALNNGPITKMLKT